MEGKAELIDSIGLGVKGDIADLGIGKVKRVRTSQIYLIEGDVIANQVEEVCSKLLTDSITQTFRFEKERVMPADKTDRGFVVEVRYRSGVTDAVGDSVKKGIKDLGIEGVKSVNSAQRYEVIGELNEDEVDLICKRLLVNEVIQEYRILGYRR